MNYRISAILPPLCLAVVISVLPLHLQAGGSALPQADRVLRNLSYVTNGHERQKLDLYLPASPRGPLVVEIHGGGWVAGSKDSPAGLHLLQQGYAVASINYRYSTHAIFPAQIEDCKAALRWLRAHAAEYGYDPSRIGAWGGSAGGHLVALLATTGSIRKFDVGENLDQSSAIQCGIDLFGPANFLGWKPPSNQPMIQRTGSESILVRLLGGPVDEKQEAARDASPVTWVTKDCAPLYIMHGDRDPLVGVEQSQELAAKLKAAGAEVTLEVVKDGEHGGVKFWPEGTPPPKRLMDFFHAHLLRR